MLFLMGMTGCTPDDDTFADQFAVLYCQRLSECYRAAYEGLYDAEAQECNDEVADQYEYVDSSSCNFDEDEAEDCLGDFRTEDCEDLFYSDSPTSCRAICG